MNIKKFSFTVLKELYINGNLKDNMDAKNYLLKFFYPLSNGMIMFVSNNKKTMLSEVIFRSTYSRIGSPLMKWFMKETEKVYDIIVDTNKPLITSDEINLFAGFKYSKDKSFAKCSKQAKNGVKMMLDFIKTVWCHDDVDSYEYIMNWIANMTQGNKNTTILYLKSFVEGIGKSTVTQFLMTYVLGKHICIESNSDPLKSPYNEIMCGKLLVVFEELESAGTNDWNVMSTKLKRWTTSDDVVYSDKYIKSYSSKNINNYIICTNQDAVKNSEGRRYYICDLNTKYKNNNTFFDNLYTNCFNDDVGKAFYIYLSEIDVSKYNPQIFKETLAKKINQCDRLHSLFKFIKFNYILNKANLLISTKNLYDDYCKYIALKSIDINITKNKMIMLLREHDIDYIKTNGNMLYDIYYDKLLLIAEKFKWMYDDDNEEQEDNIIAKSDFKKSRSMLDIELIKSQQSEIEQLKKQILELQQNSKADIETEKVTTPKKLFISTPKKASTPKKTQKDDDDNEPEKLYISNKQTSMNDMFLSTFNLVIE